MDNEVLKYVWARLPLALLFANGYLVYRLLAVTKLTDAFVQRILRLCSGRRSPLLLYLIAATAILSFFIPNAVAALTLLPIIKAIDKDFNTRRNPVRLTTALTLSVIYGANIGGMGSLIGTPANMLMLGALDLFQVPGREQINFFNWFVWSLPLVAAFVLAAWGVASLALPRKVRREGLQMVETSSVPKLTPWQSSGAKLFGLFLIFWIFEAVAKEAWPGFAAYEQVASIAFFLFFVFNVFHRSGPLCCPSSVPLLKLRDVFSGVPKRGIAFLLLLGAVILAVRLLGLDDYAAGWVRTVGESGGHGLALFLGLTVTVIFLTELLSNTLVTVAFLPVAATLAANHGLDLLPLMMAMVIGPCCAFMTPVATPCNALTFGEMRGASLKAMLLLGALLNLAGALLITFWLSWIIPLVYSG